MAQKYVHSNSQIQNEVSDLLTGAIKSKTKGTSWKILMAEVEKEFVVKNWLHIRAVLQMLINSGKIQRTASTAVEEYISTK
jgi:hypothetical protein